MAEEFNRRSLLTGAGAAATLAGLPRGVCAQVLTKKDSPQSVEGRYSLRSLTDSPEWSVPAGESNEAQHFNRLVAEWRAYYSGGKGKDILARGLMRLADNNSGHLRMILSKAQEHKIPKDIAFLALVESTWFPHGENGAKAAGYWQFIPTTAVLYGLKGVPVGTSRTKGRYTQADLLGKDERLDPEKSTDAAFKYLTFLKRFFERVAKDNGLASASEDALWTFAMWAYNRGPGHVRKTFITTGGNPLLYPSALYAEGRARSKDGAISPARRESAAYVPKILAIRDVVRTMAAAIVAERPTTLAPVSGTQQPPKKSPEPAIVSQASTAPTSPKASSPVESEPQTAPDPEEKEEVEIIRYRVQGGDNLTKIATWLSPSRDFIGLRLDQIRYYNEKINGRKYADQVNKNEYLDVPAQRVQVTPSDTVAALVKEYYPGWPENVAINMFRFINGITNGTQIIAGKSYIVPLQNH